MLPGPPFLFGAVLALAAIFVTWLIPSNFKSSVLISQRSNKDRTVVKIGNTSATYNRTSSSSSLNTNPNLLSSNVIASTSAAAASQEQQQLLLDDSHPNILSLSSNSTASIVLPSHLSTSATATTTLSHLLQNPSLEPTSTGHFLNPTNSVLIEGKNN